MITAIDDLPDGVIGFTINGKVHAADYRDTLMPAVEAAAGKGGVRLVLVFEDFDGLSAGASWQDLKMGVGHLSKWKRTALVSDIEWMNHLVSLFGWMSPGEFRHYPRAEQAEAIGWAAGTS